MIGQTFYPPGDVAPGGHGRAVPGASFTVGRLRLPRAVLAVTAGLSFGLAGVTFQTMLRNPLASPDVIGITAGASAAAASRIVTFSLSGTGVSTVAIAAALGVALLIYTLAFRDGVAGTRLILIGIGVAAMLDSVTSYVLSKAGAVGLPGGAALADRQPQRHHLGGGRARRARPARAGPGAAVPGAVTSRAELGDDTASALGVRVERTRLVAIVAAVGLIAFATAACGPIAFVSFLAGPIAARDRGADGSLLVPAALVGALLVLVADLVGQFAFGTRFPVGVVTGVLGAPYLIYLIVRTNRAGGSL